MTKGLSLKHFSKYIKYVGLFHSVNLHLPHFISFNMDCQIMNVIKGLLQNVRRSTQAPEELYREG
jgi:hypothetical protein